MLRIPIFKEFLTKSIGQKRISAPINAWKELQNKPYQNSLFSMKYDTNKQKIMIRTKPHYSESVVLAQNMLNSVDFIGELVEDNDNLIFDTGKLNIPGRWACMLHDFYFRKYDIDSIVENNENNELDFVENIEDFEEEVKYNYQMIQNPSIRLSITKSPLQWIYEPVVDNIEMYSRLNNIESKGNFYDDITKWRTYDGYCSLGTYYFMKRSGNFLSLDNIPYSEADCNGGGIAIPKSSFLSAHKLLYQKSTMFPVLCGRNNYYNNKDIQMEEMVVLEEVVRYTGGKTRMFINGRKRCD